MILTGCSAGGLATYLHADYVKQVIPQTAKYHAIADAGYNNTICHRRNTASYQSVTVDTFLMLKILWEILIFDRNISTVSESAEMVAMIEILSYNVMCIFFFFFFFLNINSQLG